jgi:hypothetical protein
VTVIDRQGVPTEPVSLNYTVSTPAGGPDAPIWAHSREDSSPPQKQESFSSVIIHEDSMPHSQAGSSFPQASPMTAGAAQLEKEAPVSLTGTIMSEQTAHPPISASSSGSSRPDASVASDPIVNATSTGNRSKTPPGHTSLSPSGAAVSESEVTEDERELSPAHPGAKLNDVRRTSAPGTLAPRVTDRQSCCCIQ